MIRATVLHAGTAAGPMLRLDAPLSLWGGFDPTTGAIIDIHHPQHGHILTRHIVLMEESRGSGTAPGTMAEAIRRGTAPLAIILIHPDTNLAIGAMVAAALYGKDCPVLAVAPEDFAKLSGMAALSIAADGGITPLQPDARLC
jgi:predicted aconitase with swiveling domain